MNTLPSYMSINRLFEECIAAHVYYPSEKALLAYQTAYRIYISPYIGSIPLNQFQREDYLKFLHQIRPLVSANRYSRITSTVMKMFDYAVSMNLIFSNPCFFVPYKQPQNYTKTILSDEQMIHIYHAVDDMPLADYYHFLICTGTRAAETLGIQITDLQYFDGRSLSIHQYLKREVHGGQLCIEKNMDRYGAARVLILPDAAIQIVEKRLSLHKAWAKEFNWHSPLSLLFEGPDTHGFSCGFMNKQNAILKRITGINNFTVQYFRDTYAIRALKAGCNQKSLQEYMGYARPNQLMNLYYNAVLAAPRNVAAATNAHYSALQEEAANE